MSGKKNKSIAFICLTCLLILSLTAFYLVNQRNEGGVVLTPAEIDAMGLSNDASLSHMGIKESDWTILTGAISEHGKKEEYIIYRYNDKINVHGIPFTKELHYRDSLILTQITTTEANWAKKEGLDALAAIANDLLAAYGEPALMEANRRDVGSIAACLKEGTLTFAHIMETYAYIRDDWTITHRKNERIDVSLRLSVKSASVSDMKSNEISIVYNHFPMG